MSNSELHVATQAAYYLSTDHSVKFHLFLSDTPLAAQYVRKMMHTDVGIMSAAQSGLELRSAAAGTLILTFYLKPRISSPFIRLCYVGSCQRPVHGLFLVVLGSVGATKHLLR